MSRSATSTSDARERLELLSRRLIDTSRHVAEEGDRWFIGAVRTADRGAQRTRTSLDALGRFVWAESVRLRPSWLRRPGLGDRIRKVLIAEAKRAHLEAPPERVEKFASDIAVLIELVLTGAIDIDAIAFEADAASGSPEDRDG